MSAKSPIVPPVTGPSSLVRPKFSPGLLLRDDDLRQGVDYTRDLSRLMFRSLFGCGVICGLEVDAETKCGKLVVTVGSGVGLTCIGDPVQVPERQTVTIDPTCGQKLPKYLWVALCRTEKCCAPRTAACACDEEEEAGTVCTRERDQFEIRILENPDCACGCTKKTAAPAKPGGTRSTPAQMQVYAQPAEATGAEHEAAMDCWCADPLSPCYRDHYDGICPCGCSDCDCIVLAVLYQSRGQKEGENGMELAGGEDGTGATKPAEGEWIADHRVRRFVRPVLMRDPAVHRKRDRKDEPCDGQESVAVEAMQVAAVDEAAKRAAEATMAVLQKGAETRAAAAAGRIEEAKAAAEAVAEMAVEAEMSASALAKKAAEAVVMARRDIENIEAEREAAAKALAEKLAAEEAAAEQAAAEAVAVPESVDETPTASTGARRSGTRSSRKTPPAKPAAS